MGSPNREAKFRLRRGEKSPFPDSRKKISGGGRGFKGMEGPCIGKRVFLGRPKKETTSREKNQAV